MTKLLVALLAVATVAACRPAPSAIPSNHTPGCDDPNVEALIRHVFVEDPNGAVRIAIRESHCEPGAYNRSGASGVFQLLGHEDLVRAVCMDGDVFNAACNILAAHLLYVGEHGWYPAWG